MGSRDRVANHVGDIGDVVRAIFQKIGVDDVHKLQRAVGKKERPASHEPHDLTPGLIGENGMLNPARVPESDDCVNQRWFDVR